MSGLTLRRRLAWEVYIRQRKLHREAHPLRQLFWECTHRCNLRCRHCGSDCKSTADLPDMPKADFLRVIDSLTPHVDQHKVSIIITGGEPLMRKDLEEVGLELYKREYPWGIVTNGLALTRTRFESLLKAGIHGMTISLDGLEDEHNWMRGNPLSFEKALAAIKMVAAEPSVNFDVVTCVNPRSMGSLDKIKELLIESGVKAWRLFTVFPSGRAKAEDFEMSKEKFKELMEFIVRTRKEGRIKASYCCEGFLENYEGEVRDHLYTCEAGVTVGSVLLDGSIAACPSIRADYSQGNIYEDDFWDVWQNRYHPYRDRSWMKTGKCSDCSMFRYCEGNGMHLRDSEGNLMHCNLI